MKNLIMKLLSFLAKANSESENNPSHIRVTTFYAIVILVPCVAFTLIWVTITKELSGLIVTVLGSVLLFLTGLLGIKKLQKKDENDGTVQ